MSTNQPIPYLLQQASPEDFYGSQPPPAPVAAAPASTPAPPPAALPMLRQPPEAIPQLRGYQPSPLRQRQEQNLQQSLLNEENPTAPHGFWGKAGHILGTIGNDLGNVILGTDKMSAIPGTAAYKAAQHGATERELEGLEKEDQTEESNQAREQLEGAQAGKTAAEAAVIPGETGDKHALTQSEIDKNNAEIYGLENPWAKMPDNQPITNADNLQKGFEDRYHVLNPGQPLPPEFTLPQNPTKGDYDRIDKLLAGVESAQGTKEQQEQSNALRQAMFSLAAQNAGDKNLWSVPQPDGSSKVVSLRPGDTIPKGAVSLSGQSGQNAKAGGADVQASLTYANDYLNSGAWTGPGDEALQDQFFNLAKPSSGFRMNQAQIDQLHNMASWMDSWRGKAYHAINGTWFAPEQRRQIVDTMNALASSKGVTEPANAGAKEPPRPAGAPPNAKFNANGPQGPGYYW
jgi:hypothetical protein